MRRLRVLAPGSPRRICLLVIVVSAVSLLGLVAAPGSVVAAWAAGDAAGASPTPIAVGGPSVTATVQAPATQAQLSFSLVQPTTVTATFLSWTFPADGAVTAYLTYASGGTVGSVVPLNGSGPWSAPPQRLAAGSYDVVVDTGSSGDSGSVTVQLTPVGSIAVNSAPVTASIGAAGQPALFAFHAAAGATVALAAAQATFGVNTGATIAIENSAGVPQGPVRFVGDSSATAYASATLRTAGTYYVALRPGPPP